MTFGDVYEKGCDFWLVMFMDRRYRFGDVKELDYFSDVKELQRWQLVMSMNRGMFINWWCSWIQNIVLVMLRNLFIPVMLTKKFDDKWWCLWTGVWLRLVMLMDRKYLFGDVNGFNHFSDVNKLGKWLLAMLMNRDTIGDDHG